MANLKLIIGNKNYSSWSLRPWLLMRHLALEFDEVRIPLRQPETRAEILKHSPAGKVPILEDGSLVIWESLAICEYLAERHRGVWPSREADRAWARSVSTEMHAGFAAMRTEMPMNVRKRRRVQPSPAARADIARVQDIWRSCREAHRREGPWLFGAFSIADAMFAPVVTRFTTYGVECDPVILSYMDTVWSHPAMQQWLRAAQAETEVIEDSEDPPR